MEDTKLAGYNEIVEAAMILLEKYGATENSYKFYEWRKNCGYAVEISVRKVSQIDDFNERDNEDAEHN